MALCFDCSVGRVVMTGACFRVEAAIAAMDGPIDVLFNDAGIAAQEGTNEPGQGLLVRMSSVGGAEDTA